MSTECVGIVRVNEQRLDEALERVVGLLGDLQKIIPRGSRVLIKPNFVFPPTNRGITHPQLVEAVVRLAAEAGAEKIQIGEGSADVYTSQGYRFQGMDGVAARYGAELVDLNLEEGVRKGVPEGLGRGGRRGGRWGGGGITSGCPGQWPCATCSSLCRFSRSGVTIRCR